MGGSSLVPLASPEVRLLRKPEQWRPVYVLRESFRKV